MQLCTEGFGSRLCSLFQHPLAVSKCSLMIRLRYLYSVNTFILVVSLTPYSTSHLLQATPSHLHTAELVFADPYYLHPLLPFQIICQRTDVQRDDVIECTLIKPCTSHQEVHCAIHQLTPHNSGLHMLPSETPPITPVNPYLPGISTICSHSHYHMPTKINTCYQHSPHS